MKKTDSEISHKSYTPYSKNSELSLILGESGVWYPGTRVENISFPLTIPAIQSAICSCLGNEDKPIAIFEQNSIGKFSDYWIQTFDLTKLDEIPKNALIYDPLLYDVENVTKRLKYLCDMSVSDKSDFPVSALLKTKKGYIPGVNIEFQDWNLGLCAERVAIMRAIASDYDDFLEMHIYAPKSTYVSPCGACRQVLFEFMPNQVIVLYHDDESTSRHFVSHLLPNNFTTNYLKK